MCRPKLLSGRTLARSFADFGQGNFRNHPNHRLTGRDHPSGGTKRPHGPVHIPFRAHPGKRQIRPQGKIRRPHGKQGCKGILYGRPLRIFHQGLPAVEEEKSVEVKITSEIDLA